MERFGALLARLVGQAAFVALSVVAIPVMLVANWFELRRRGFPVLLATVAAIDCAFGAWWETFTAPDNFRGGRK